MPNDSPNSLVERNLSVLEAVDSGQRHGLGKTALQELSIDPPFNPTPRSSVSSRFRSMLSLRNRLKSKDAGGSTTNETFSDRMSIQSSESWSLQY